MKALVRLVVVVSALVCVSAAASMTAAQHLRHANQSLHSARTTLRFFEHHTKLLYGGPLKTRHIAWREVHRARAVIRRAQIERSAAVAALTPYTTMYVTVTEYAPGCGDSGHGTATGTTPHWGTIAVDPGLIPLGSKVYVAGYGWSHAEDTGGAIGGAHIDAWVPSCSQAVTRYHVPIRVY